MYGSFLCIVADCEEYDTVNVENEQVAHQISFYIQDVHASDHFC